MSPLSLATWPSRRRSYNWCHRRLSHVTNTISPPPSALASSVTYQTARHFTTEPSVYNCLYQQTGTYVTRSARTHTHTHTIKYVRYNTTFDDVLRAVPIKTRLAAVQAAPSNYHLLSTPTGHVYVYRALSLEHCLSQALWIVQRILQQGAYTGTTGLDRNSP